MPKKSVVVTYSDISGKPRTTLVLGTEVRRFASCLYVVKRPIDQTTSHERRWDVYHRYTPEPLNETPFEKKAQATAFAQAVLQEVLLQHYENPETGALELPKHLCAAIRSLEAAAHKE